MKLAVQLPSASGVAVKTTTAVWNGVPSMGLPVPGGPVRAPVTEGVPAPQFDPETVTSVNWLPWVGATVSGSPAWLEAVAVMAAVKASAMSRTAAAFLAGLAPKCAAIGMAAPLSPIRVQCDRARPQGKNYENTANGR